MAQIVMHDGMQHRVRASMEMGHRVWLMLRRRVGYRHQESSGAMRG
ncbi:MAG: hypothetical protein ABI351_08870 [Herbaspirillum sp.]